MRNRFYITTPLYYVNASPHIGHSYTNISCDCLGRYMRRRLGDANVWFLTGTDEHGQKIQKAAQDAGFEPGQFADKMVLQFKRLWKDLNISFNDFIRTTEKRHILTVQRVLEILHEKGDIYPAKYEGFYCTPCETFWTKTQIYPDAPDNEKRGSENCPDCKRHLEYISETNFFFKLSLYQDWLISYIKDNPVFIRPKIRQHEVLSFLEMQKLSDLCISRPRQRLTWGIPLPFSQDHVCYVWFDALINYISAVGSFDQNNNYNSQWWPADLHLIGKDILRQHAIYWPIMLRALNIALPKTVFAHGWWMVDESKMSKSRGNVVSALEMAEKYGIDTYRYFLLRNVPFGLDGNFSEESIINRFNSDLANDLGNLVYRVLTMIEKYFAGRIPACAAAEYNPSAQAIKAYLEALDGEISAVFTADGDYNFSLALEKIWLLINMANKYIEDTKPWILFKENKIEELRAFIGLLIEVIKKVSDSLWPFMPQTAESITEQIGKEKITKGLPLFPRIQ